MVMEREGFSFVYYAFFLSILQSLFCICFFFLSFVLERVGEGHIGMGGKEIVSG